MPSKSLVLIAALGPIFASSCAGAADICFQYGSGGGVIVAKGATLPQPNSCITVPLVEQIEGGRIGLATGSICLSNTGDSAPTLVYQYTYDACSGPGGYFESATCRIDIAGSSNVTADLPPRPTPQPSSCNGVYADPESGQSGSLTQFTDLTLKAWKCEVPYVPGGGSSLQCLGFPTRRK
jgi:hypothetical protein